MQAVTYLIADPGVTSSILIRSNSFVEIDHEIISMVILLPSTDSRNVVSYTNTWLNAFDKLAQEKSVVR